MIRARFASGIQERKVQRGPERTLRRNDYGLVQVVHHSLDAMSQSGLIEFHEQAEWIATMLQVS